jgi:hypothetical protein
MKRALTLVLLVAGVVSGCAPSDSAVQTAIARTQAAGPPPAPVLSSEALRMLLILQGDLPEDYEAVAYHTRLSSWFDGGPMPDYWAGRNLTYKGNDGGSAQLAVYMDTSQSGEAYKAAARRLSEPSELGESGWVEVGEEAAMTTTNLMMYTASIAFRRCTAVVALQFIFTHKGDEALSYARRLDERLKPLVCK